MIEEKYFTFNFVNGISGDPAIYVQNRRSGKAFLWDIAPLYNLSEKEHLKIERVFISHNHMDHFMGIDSLIRFNLPHKRPLYFYGPVDLAKRIMYRLNSYVWNLIDVDAVIYYVIEIDNANIKKFKISMDPETREFVSTQISSHRRDETPWIETLANGDKIGAICLDHINIDSISYFYKIANEFKVNTEAVGSNSGPWISNLIKTMKSGNRGDKVWTPDGEQTAMKACEKYLIEQSGPCVSYTTDIGFTKGNVSKFSGLNLRVDTAFVESSFMDKERERARIRHHLTTAQSACIANLLSAKKYYPFHFSQLYKKNSEAVEEEALDFFDKYKKVQELFEDCLMNQSY